MNIEQMHIELKHRLNKVDSQQNLNLRVPQLDLFLNNALRLFVRLVAEPRQYAQGLGFELSQRNIDDISPLVENNVDLLLTNTTGMYVAALPDNYMFHLSSYATIEKNTCAKVIKTTVIQHDDSEGDMLSRSSLEWETVNIRFFKGGIRIFNNDFTPISLKLDYIRTPLYIHNAQNYGSSGSYKLADGTVLTGKQDSELADHTGDEIVNIARHLILKSISNQSNVPQSVLDNS